MLQIAGGILLAVGAIYGFGLIGLWLLSLLTRERVEKSPKQFAAEEFDYLRRRRIAFRIVLSVLGVWAVAVTVSLLVWH